MTKYTLVLFILSLGFIFSATVTIPRPETLPENFNLKITVRHGHRFRLKTLYSLDSSTNEVFLNIFHVQAFSKTLQRSQTSVFSDETCRLYAIEESVPNADNSSTVWRFRFETLEPENTAAAVAAFVDNATKYDRVTVFANIWNAEDWLAPWTDGVINVNASSDYMTVITSDNTTITEAALLKVFEAVDALNSLFYEGFAPLNLTDAFYQHPKVQELDRIELAAIANNGITDSSLASLNATRLRLGPTPQLTESAILHFLDPALMPQSTHKMLEATLPYQVNISTWLVGYSNVTSSYSSDGESCTFYRPSDRSWVRMIHTIDEESDLFHLYVD